MRKYIRPTCLTDIGPRVKYQACKELNSTRCIAAEPPHKAAEQQYQRILTYFTYLPTLAESTSTLKQQYFCLVDSHLPGTDKLRTSHETRPI